MNYDKLALAMVQVQESISLESEISNFNKIIESVNILNENGLLLEVDMKEVWEKVKEKAKTAIQKIKDFFIKIKNAIVSFIKNMKDKIKSFVNKKVNIPDFPIYIDFNEDKNNLDIYENCNLVHEEYSGEKNIEKLQKQLTEMINNDPMVFFNINDFINIGSLNNLIKLFKDSILKSNNLDEINLVQAKDTFNNEIEQMIKLDFKFTNPSVLYGSFIIREYRIVIAKKIDNMYNHKSLKFRYLADTITSAYNNNIAALESISAASDECVKLIDRLSDLEFDSEEGKDNLSDITHIYRFLISCMNTFSGLCNELKTLAIKASSRQIIIKKFINFNEGVN